MNELLKILSKSNSLVLLKQTSIREQIKKMEEVLKPFQIDCTCKNDYDYFNLCILYQGYLNKAKLEAAYEEISKEMFEIWHDLDYKKRNEFASNAMIELKEKLCFFKVNDQKIFIPFFDVLMNTLYDKEVAVLQLPQFFKLYKEFKDRMIDPIEYLSLPYQSGFVDVLFIHSNENGFGFYVKENHSIYIIDKNKKVIMIPLSLKHKTEFHEPERAVNLVEAVLENNVKDVLQWCVNCGQIDEKSKSKCITRLNKMK